MSRDIEGTPPPRRPKPKSPPAALAEGQDTFQPSSAPLPRPAPVGGRSKKADREPIPAIGGPKFLERVFFGKVGSGHLATFCNQLANYQDAGVDLLRSLTNLQKQFARTALGPVIGRMEVGVRSGEPMAEVMAREPQAFDKLCVAMMRVAGARGGEPETLHLLARHYEARQRMIRQARSAMIYPSIVLVVAFAVIMLLTIFVIPGMVSFIADSMRGKSFDLPWPTRVLMGISKFMTTVGWFVVPIAVVGGLLGSLWWYQTPAGRVMLDNLSLYVPVLGKIRKKIETGRFSRTLAALLHAGVDVGTSLDLTAGVVGLSPYRRAILGAKTLVMDGEELSRALNASGRFGLDVVAIVESGEESGRLPESLDKVADDYEEQVEYMLKNLGNLIQPILMIGLGGVVLFIVLGVIMAYIQMISSAAG